MDLDCWTIYYSSCMVLSIKSYFYLKIILLLASYIFTVLKYWYLCLSRFFASRHPWDLAKVALRLCHAACRTQSKRPAKASAQPLLLPLPPLPNPEDGSPDAAPVLRPCASAHAASVPLPSLPTPWPTSNHASLQPLSSPAPGAQHALPWHPLLGYPLNSCSMTTDLWRFAKQHSFINCVFFVFFFNR